jgi:hypothetical protein
VSRRSDPRDSTPSTRREHHFMFNHPIFENRSVDIASSHVTSNLIRVNIFIFSKVTVI